MPVLLARQLNIRQLNSPPNQFFAAYHFCLNFLVCKHPETLAGIAAERTSLMMLLPYGIPIAIGCIMYFAMAGKLVT